MDVKQIVAGDLNVGYIDAGPEDGTPVLLLHGWPYDIHSYVDVAPLLTAQGYRVIIPYLRGYGTTHFLSEETFRNANLASSSLPISASLGPAFRRSPRPRRPESPSLSPPPREKASSRAYPPPPQLPLASGLRAPDRLAEAPDITVPAITLEGDTNGAPHPEPNAYAKKFTGRYSHRTIEGGIGHNLPQEAPEPFAKAVIDVDAYQ